MIPSSIDYRCPLSPTEVCDLLSSCENAKILAGGHSIIPMLKLRFATPDILIDINKINEWKGVSEADGKIVVGSLTSEREIIENSILAKKCPLLSQAARQIADPIVRNLGTIGGDISHGDPANDHPAVAITLNATFRLLSSRGTREVLAREFYKGPYWTELQDDEVLTHIIFNPIPNNAGSAYKKLKRKTGDWATAACAAIVEMDGDSVSRISLGLTNVAPTPIHAHESEEALLGKQLTDENLSHACELAVKVADPEPDLRGSSEYKAAMAGVMMRRAIESATGKI